MILKHELDQARQLYLQKLAEVDPNQSHFVALGEVAKIFPSEAVILALLAEIAADQLPKVDENSIEIKPRVVEPLLKNSYNLIDQDKFQQARSNLLKLIGQNTVEELPWLINTMNQASDNKFSSQVLEYLGEYIMSELEQARKEYDRSAAILHHQQLEPEKITEQALAQVSLSQFLPIIVQLLRNELYYAT